jgi:uncharacterized membrane protein YhaH (DUF805 family)
MDFVTAVKTCFRKYASSKGRALRSEYWWWTLFTTIGSIVLTVLNGVIFGTSFEETGVLDGIFALVTFLPSFAVAFRRLHDVGRSAWWMLLALTVIGILVLLYWLIIEGDKGDNAYGPHPLSDSIDSMNEVFR